MSNSDIWGSVISDLLIITAGGFGTLLAAGAPLNWRGAAAAVTAGVVAAAKEYRQCKKLAEPSTPNNK